MIIKNCVANLIHDGRIIYKLCSQILKFMVPLIEAIVWCKIGHYKASKEWLTGCVATGKLRNTATSN